MPHVIKTGHCVTCDAVHLYQACEEYQKSLSNYDRRYSIHNNTRTGKRLSKLDPEAQKDLNHEVTRKLTASELSKEALVKYVPRYLENMGVMVHKNRVYINLVCEDGTRLTLNMDTVLIKALGRQQDKDALAEWIKDKRKQVF